MKATKTSIDSLLLTAIIMESRLSEKNHTTYKSGWMPTAIWFSIHFLSLNAYGKMNLILNLFK